MAYSELLESIDRELLVIGKCLLEEAPYYEMWYAKWAIEMMSEGFVLDTKAGSTRMEDGKIYRNSYVKGVEFVFVLTDEYDEAGRQRAVWPD